MAAEIPAAARKILDAPNFYYVGTVRKDGSVHVTPAWGRLAGDLIEVNTAEGRGWPTNLLRDPRLTITVADGDNPYSYTSIRGRVVERITDGADAHIDELAHKYIGSDYPGHRPNEVRVILRIAPEHVFERIVSMDTGEIAQQSTGS